MLASRSDARQILNSFITPRISENMQDCRYPYLDARTSPVVDRSSYSILLAIQTERPKVHEPLTNWSPVGVQFGTVRIVTPNRGLVVVGAGGRPLVVNKVVCLERCSDCGWRIEYLAEVETVGEIVERIGVGKSQSRYIKVFLDELQDAAKIVRNLRNMFRFGQRRHHDERHAESVDVARSPTAAIVDDLGRCHVVVPASPIVPDDDDRGVRPVSTTCNGIDDGSDPRGPSGSGGLTRVVGVRARGNDPTHLLQLTSGNVGKNRRIPNAPRREGDVIDVIAPGANGAIGRRIVGNADVLDRGGSGPDGSGQRRIVAPGDTRVAEFIRECGLHPRDAGIDGGIRGLAAIRVDEIDVFRGRSGATRVSAGIRNTKRIFPDEQFAAVGRFGCSRDQELVRGEAGALV